MSKYIAPILIGLVAAVVAGFVFRMLIGMSWVTLYMGVFIGLLTAYLLANLAGNRKVAAASDAERDHALQLQPPPGMALLVIYRQGFVGMAAGLNVSVDGQDVAQLKSPRFTTLVVAPGTHMLSAGFGGLAGPQNKRSTAQVELAAGHVLAVLVGVSMGLLQNSVTFTPQTDLNMVRDRLSGMTMVHPLVG